MIGGLKPLTQVPTLGLRSQTCYDPWGNALVQYHDAMRDLRIKIRVLQMPLFKVILVGEVKDKIFVSTR